MSPAPFSPKRLDGSIWPFHDERAQRGQFVVADLRRHPAGVFVGIYRSALTMPSQNSGDRRLADFEEHRDLRISPAATDIRVYKTLPKI